MIPQGYTYCAGGLKTHEPLQNFLETLYESARLLAVRS
jgi:hypothetical protein